MAVSFSGDSIAAAFTAGVLNDAYSMAANLSGAASARIDQAIGAVTTVPKIPKEPSLPHVDVPALQPLSAEDRDVSGVEAKVQALATSYRNVLVGDFTTFLNTYFPLGNELQKARTWISNAIDGSTGINPAIEQQLWGRDRDRVLAEQARAEEEVVTTWAARRFPLPPGVATYQVLQLQRTSMAQIGESSRNAAIESFKTAVENARFAVQRAVDMRAQAIQSAGEYIKTLALAPQLATDLEKALVDAKTKMASMVGEYYRAQLAAIDATLKVPLAQADINFRTDNTDIQNELKLLDLKVKATTDGAQLMATQAAAVLNGFHAQVGLTGQESL